MKACHYVQITTPKKVVLNGLWWGNAKPTRVIIWVHGLGSSAFSRLDLIAHIIDRSTAVVTFNNRGHDVISRYKRGEKSHLGGAGHEVFTDCVDDIQGVINCAKRSGAKEIYLAGHSTGCQKSVYWAAKEGKGVKGVVLLAPISDFTIGSKDRDHSRALSYARSLVRQRRQHELLPPSMTSHAIDAQRYVSLFSGESAEEIFPYWEGARKPKILRSVTIPLLVLLAQRDEYADRPAKKIQKWFQEHCKTDDTVVVVGRADHGFAGAERETARIIRDFMQKSR